MTPDEYVSSRLDHQIDWYDGKSSFNQKWFKKLQLISIVAAASIPFWVGFSTIENEFIRVLIGILGLLVAALTATLSLYKFQEHWIEYRTTCETLRHEKYLYLTNTTPYNIDDPFSLLVQRVESIISKENSDWGIYMKKESDNNG